MSVGANIKKRRFELKMSQQELAEAMGYKTRSTIAKIESGENDVTQKKLQRFAVVLDTTVEALVAGSTNVEEDIPTLTKAGLETVFLASASVDDMADFLRRRLTLTGTY